MFSIEANRESGYDFKICFYSGVLVYNNQHDHVAYFGIMYYAIVHEQSLKKRIASQRKHVERNPVPTYLNTIVYKNTEI